MKIFDAVESEVRAYCRYWPTVFVRAEGSMLLDERGRSFIDFFAGAGALNYGHNHPVLRDALVQYLLDDGIVHGLDMATAAKRTFLEAFNEVVLRRRSAEYKIQFPGPAGANAVEAALKLARKVTARPRILGFSGGFHGMTVGAMQVSDPRHRNHIGAGTAGAIAFDDETRAPAVEDFERAVLQLGFDPAQLAAVIIETVQGEGGVRVACGNWLAMLERFCRTHGILLIIDDIQAGCGRTGPFLSFEAYGIEPDMVCLYKSISGFGLPLSLLLIRPCLDIWSPGEHNGTFRGDNLAFIAGAVALELFWNDDRLQRTTEARHEHILMRLRTLVARRPDLVCSVSGRGMFWGVKTSSGAVAAAVRDAAFERGLLLETCGASGEIVKLIPPLTISDEELDRGLCVLEECIAGARRFGENIDDCSFV